MIIDKDPPLTADGKAGIHSQFLFRPHPHGHQYQISLKFTSFFGFHGHTPVCREERFYTFCQTEVYFLISQFPVDPGRHLIIQGRKHLVPLFDQ